MDQFFSSLPKPVLAIGAILIGFIVIVLSDRPRTVCNTQLDVVKESQQDFLFFRHGAGNSTKPAEIGELVSRCKGDNSPGGCFELFQKLKRLQADLVNVPNECAEDAMGVGQLKGGLLQGMSLMAQVAWGEKGPTSFLKRNGWLDASDVALFCDLKKSAIRMLGQDAFQAWRDSAIAALPGSDVMEGDQAYQRSLYSAPCSEYR